MVTESSIAPIGNPCVATAVIETGAGLTLLILPSTTAVLLLDVPLQAAAEVTVARVAGMALVTLGVASWLARGDTQGRAARGFVGAMVLYNLGVALVLGDAGVASHLIGIALWPAVALHLSMTAWCIASFLGQSGLMSGHQG